MEIDVTPDVKLEKQNDDQQCGEDVSEESQINNTDAMSSTNCSYSDKNNGSSITNAHNKKVIKHALRQQAKRRRKNTTIASGNTATVPRIIVKPLPPQPTEEVTPVPTIKTPTMREVLASIPGFSIKPRRRSNKKLSTAAQLEQTKEGCIDLETPDSILVNTNLRALLNKYTFAALPPLYQNKLVQLLPSVDRQIVTNPSESPIRLSTSGLNNEFFARACLEWQERLAEGEFTPENQQKLKSEADRERSRVDPWKLKHFEPIWGDRNVSDDITSSLTSSRPPIKTTIKLRPSTTVSKSKPPLIKRLRTVGAMTRSCTNYRLSEQPEPLETTNTKSPIPDLLPIRTHKNQMLRKEAALKQSESVVAPSEKSSESSVINISDTILQTNEETIISCIENSRNNKLNDKRRRSPSSDFEERPPKRKTPSPVQTDTQFEVTEIQSAYDESSEESLESHSHTKNSPFQLDANESAEFSKEEYVDGLLDEPDVKNNLLETISLPESTESGECIQQSTVIEPSVDFNPHQESAFCNPEPPQVGNEHQDTDYQDSDHTNQTEPTRLHEPFEILPNTLILQQDSLVLDKTVCSDSCVSGVCLEDSEKLEASVEESDLVIAQISKTNFEVANIADDDEANEDRFIDAENYVLESGQIPDSEKVEKVADESNIGTDVFGAPNITAGNNISTKLNCFFCTKKYYFLLMQRKF